MCETMIACAIALGRDNCFDYTVSGLLFIPILFKYILANYFSLFHCCWSGSRVSGGGSISFHMTSSSLVTVVTLCWIIQLGCRSKEMVMVLGDLLPAIYLRAVAGAAASAIATMNERENTKGHWNVWVCERVWSSDWTRLIRSPVRRYNGTSMYACWMLKEC